MIDTSAVTPAALPSVSIDERRELPDTAAIYFVLTGTAVLYIGQSVSLRQRCLAHHRLAQLNERGGCRIAWMMVDDTSLLDELEQACITHFQPVLNGTEIGDNEVWQATLRLPRDLEPAVKEVARQRLVPPTIALRQLIKERLDQLAADTRRLEREGER